MIAVDFRIDGGRRAVQLAGPHACGGDRTEIGECFIAEIRIIFPVFTSDQLVNHPLVIISALFFHGESDRYRLFHRVVPDITGVCLGFFLGGNPCCRGKVTHVDGENHVIFVGIRLDNDTADHAALLHVGVVGAHRHLQFLTVDRYGDNVPIRKALVQECAAAHGENQVSVFLDFHDICRCAFCADPRKGCEHEAKNKEERDCFFQHTG